MNACDYLSSLALNLTNVIRHVYPIILCVLKTSFQIKYRIYLYHIIQTSKYCQILQMHVNLVDAKNLFVNQIPKIAVLS